MQHKIPYLYVNISTNDGITSTSKSSSKKLSGTYLFVYLDI